MKTKQLICKGGIIFNQFFIHPPLRSTLQFFAKFLISFSLNTRLHIPNWLISPENSLSNTNPVLFTFFPSITYPFGLKNDWFFKYSLFSLTRIWLSSAIMHWLVFPDKDAVKWCHKPSFIFLFSEKKSIFPATSMRTSSWDTFKKCDVIELPFLLANTRKTPFEFEPK